MPTQKNVDTMMLYSGPLSVCLYLSLSLSLLLSGACHVDVAASMSWRHVDLSKAPCLAVARPKLSGRRSSLTVLNQVYLGLPVLCMLPVFWKTLKAGLVSVYDKGAWSKKEGAVDGTDG